jgi:hypothetical protein
MAEGVVTRRACEGLPRRAIPCSLPFAMTLGASKLEPRASWSRFTGWYSRAYTKVVDKADSCTVYTLKYKKTLWTFVKT